MRTILLLALAFSINALNAQTTLTASDFKNLDGTSWKGNLMYVNYGDGREVKLRTTMQLKIKGNKISMDTQYTDEPSANGTDTIKISSDGKYLGKEEVIEKEVGENGYLKIVTRYEGKDNNRPAIMTKTYLITENTFSVSKEVSYKDTTEVLIRNKTSYTKL
ncbi:hypothetical protein FK220_011975 [Flavobacteriaceae bacterium TP-CH-4]|uniref:Lipocalin-like domain-containing protein n=1 Tax=Pelagihabitans pacificus TaxID=2696054 RepID=A0A967AVC6_9FLAO|nr:hypothetical protein [Pelagihabitans pacificus]NHF60065.1 hypothetical protein [Pelagihabitans pacificus]